MRRMLRGVGIGLAVLIVVGAALALWKRTEITRLLAVNSLFEPDRIVANFGQMGTMFLTAPLPRGAGPLGALPVGAPLTLPPEAEAFIRDRRVTALVVLRDGAIRHESYHLGTTATDHRISWSVAKSFLSALLGILHADGTLPDLDAQVTTYAPALSGSAYDGATIRNVLNMASGVAFNEDYFDFNSDINRMGRVLALGGSLDAFTADLTARRGAPGADWQYVSIDTHVLGMVIRGATGRRIVDLMAERLITPLGLEADAFYLTDGLGEPFVLGGLNLITRDYARFAAMIAADGIWNGAAILPAEWIAASTTATAPGGAGYGYQWWVPPASRPGEVMGRGIYGQYLYIDRTRGVAIAANGADPEFQKPAVEAAVLAAFRAMSDALAP